MLIGKASPGQQPRNRHQKPKLTQEEQITMNRMCKLAKRKQPEKEKAVNKGKPIKILINSDMFKFATEISVFFC